MTKSRAPSAKSADSVWLRRPNARRSPFVEDADESEIGALHLIIDLPGSLADDVADLRSLSEQATQLRQAESLKRAGLARALLAQDLPMRDVGAILGISHQGVAQIVAADSGTHRR